MHPRRILIFSLAAIALAVSAVAPLAQPGTVYVAELALADGSGCCAPAAAATSEPHAMHRAVASAQTRGDRKRALALAERLGDLVSSDAARDTLALQPAK